MELNPARPGVDCGENGVAPGALAGVHVLDGSRVLSDPSATMGGRLAPPAQGEHTAAVPGR